MHSLLITHYLNGAWYPKGGASEIAYHMIPIIEKAGGAVLVRAPVNRILFNGAKEACGGCDFLSFPIHEHVMRLPQRGDSVFHCVCLCGFRCERHEKPGGNTYQRPNDHL